MLKYRSTKDLSVFSVSCKIVCRWVTTNCCFMSDMEKYVVNFNAAVLYARDMCVQKVHIAMHFILARIVPSPKCCI
jgi:hypothetical protein